MYTCASRIQRHTFTSTNRHKRTYVYIKALAFALGHMLLHIFYTDEHTCCYTHAFTQMTTHTFTHMLYTDEHACFYANEHTNLYTCSYTDDFTQTSTQPTCSVEIPGRARVSHRLQNRQKEKAAQIRLRTC